MSSAVYPATNSQFNNMFTIQHSLDQLKSPVKQQKTHVTQQPVPAQMKREWRGTCRYKSGRCSNERTLKFNGEIHTMCEEHRIRHNNNQRRSDLKRRIKKTPEYTSYTYKGVVMPVVKSPTGPTTVTSDIRRPTPINYQPTVAQQVKSDFLVDIDMTNDEEKYCEMRPEASTMELTPQEIKILHCILGMDSEPSYGI